MKKESEISVSIAAHGPDATMVLNIGHFSRRLGNYSFDSMWEACGKKAARLKGSDSVTGTWHQVECYDVGFCILAP